MINACIGVHVPILFFYLIPRFFYFSCAVSPGNSSFCYRTLSHEELIHPPQDHRWYTSSCICFNAKRKPFPSWSSSRAALVASWEGPETRDHDLLLSLFLTICSSSPSKSKAVNHKSFGGRASSQIMSFSYTGISHPSFWSSMHSNTISAITEEEDIITSRSMSLLNYYQVLEIHSHGGFLCPLSLVTVLRHGKCQATAVNAWVYPKAWLRDDPFLPTIMKWNEALHSKQTRWHLLSHSRMRAEPSISPPLFIWIVHTIDFDQNEHCGERHNRWGYRWHLRNNERLRCGHSDWRVRNISSTCLSVPVHSSALQLEISKWAPRLSERWKAQGAGGKSIAPNPYPFPVAGDTWTALILNGTAYVGAIKAITSPPWKSHVRVVESVCRY